MSRVPFNQAEVDNATETPGVMGRVVKRFQTPITPKENYRMIYNREVPLWLPNSGDSLSITPRIDADNIARVFVSEANPLTQEERDLVATEGYKDKFGVTWIYVPMVNGSMVKPGNPVLDDVNNWREKIEWPDVDSWDWEASKAANADYVNTDRRLTATILTGFFERLISFMDFDKAALALIDEDQKDAVHELFDALADVYIKMVDKYIWAYGIDNLSLHDDWGSQRSPFFSLATIREMLVPHIKKVVDYCHSRGVFLDMHSCGKNEMIVPAYIEMGCDSWSGQSMNDKQKLYDMYGGQIILGIETDLVAAPNQPVDEEEAKASAKRFVDKFCPDYATKPVFASAMAAPVAFLDTLYVESRKAFNP